MAFIVGEEIQDAARTQPLQLIARLRLEFVNKTVRIPDALELHFARLDHLQLSQGVGDYPHPRLNRYGVGLQNRAAQISCKS